MANGGDVFGGWLLEGGWRVLLDVEGIGGIDDFGFGWTGRNGNGRDGVFIVGEGRMWDGIIGLNNEFRLFCEGKLSSFLL